MNIVSDLALTYALSDLSKHLECRNDIQVMSDHKFLVPLESDPAIFYASNA